VFAAEHVGEAKFPFSFLLGGGRHVGVYGEKKLGFGGVGEPFVGDDGDAGGYSAEDFRGFVEVAVADAEDC
jgi:hypothetical protein